MNLEARELAESDDNTFKALGLILAAWDEGTESGVASEQMAYAALFAALTDLVALYGEDAVIELARWEGWMVYHPLPAQNARGTWRTAQAGDTGFTDNNRYFGNISVGCQGGRTKSMSKLAG